MVRCAYIPSVCICLLWQCSQLTLTFRKTQKSKLKMFNAASISPNKSYALLGFQTPVLHPGKFDNMGQLLYMASTLLAYQLQDALPPSQSKACHGKEVALDAIGLHAISGSATCVVYKRCRTLFGCSALRLQQTLTHLLAESCLSCVWLIPCTQAHFPLV